MDKAMGAPETKADQVWLHWRRSKADQLGRGQASAFARVPGSPRCVVNAIEEIHRRFPERSMPFP